MGTKGPTGAGIQHTQRGPVQGVHLVGPSGEPIAAIVDGSGRLRLAVDADLTISNPSITVDLDAATGDNVAIADQTGTNFLAVEADGTIYIRLLDESGVAFSAANPLPVELNSPIEVDLDAAGGDNVAISGHPTQIFAENAVSMTTTSYTTLLSYTAAVDNSNIAFVEVEGPMNALIRMQLNGSTIRQRRLNQSVPNVDFLFAEPRRIDMGDTITVDVKLQRTPPTSMVGGADFFASLQGFVDA